MHRTRVTLGTLYRQRWEDLSSLTGIPPERCRQLVSLALFQTLDSVGPSIADDLYALGYRTIPELAQASPTVMYQKLCHLAGNRIDPCVEDVFRCAVAQARNADLPEQARQWWYWTPYRGTNNVDPETVSDRDRK